MKYSYYFILLFFITSCIKGKKVEFIYHNATIHSCQENNAIYEAMAINDNSITELGAERQILNKYRSETDVDLEGKHIYPTLIDGNFKLFEIMIQRFSIETKEVKNENHLTYLIEKKLENTQIPVISINSNNFNIREICAFLTTHFPKNKFYIFSNNEGYEYKSSPITILNKLNEKDIISNILKSNFQDFKNSY
jgi:hypothetical protein